MGIKQTGATQSRPSFDSRDCVLAYTHKSTRSIPTPSPATNSHISWYSFSDASTTSFSVVDVKPHIFSTSTRKPCGFLGAPKAIFQNQLVVLTYIRLTTKIIRAESSAIVRALPRIPILSPVINAFLRTALDSVIIKNAFLIVSLVSAFSFLATAFSSELNHLSRSKREILFRNWSASMCQLSVKRSAALRKLEDCR